MMRVHQAWLRCFAFSSLSPAEYFGIEQHHEISAKEPLGVSGRRKILCAQAFTPEVKAMQDVYHLGHWCRR
jgi:hypothetical protein